MDHPAPASPLITRQHCSYLRHKGMYVMAEIDESDPFAGSSGATAYWCARTQKSFGPDGEAVTRDACQHGRGCCS